MTSTPPTTVVENDAIPVHATLSWTRDNLDGCSELRVLRHFTTDPINGVSPSLESAIGIVIDLQFYPQNPKEIIPELEDKLTQVEYTVFLMAALRKCKSPADFTTLLRTAITHYVRVIENFHLRSSAPRFVDSEKKSLFCPTRFLTQKETHDLLEDILNN